jgi:Luciferase-like monooxygenase/Cupin domain
MFRVEMAPAAGGPGPHFHETMSESFVVLTSTMSLFNDHNWIDATAGDFLYVPPGTNSSWPGQTSTLRDKLASVAEFLDTTNVDTLWVSDHLWQADPTGRPDQPMLEEYTTVGFLADQTSRIRLGTAVTAATIQAPALRSAGPARCTAATWLVRLL